jgi:hypothetical protein
MNDSLNLNPSVLIWFAGGFFLFFGLSVFRYIRKILRKREAFREAARGMGFHYFSLASGLTRAGYDLPEPLKPRHARPHLGNLALGPGCQNILRAEKKGWILYYLESPSSEREGSMETLALFQSPGANLPYFELVPLRLFDKFHRLLELDIRDIVSGPAMSRLEIKGLGDFRRPRHHLWGESQKVQEFDHLFSKEFLEDLGGHGNWRLQARGDWVMIFEENIAVPPVKLPEFAEETQKSAELFFNGLGNSVARIPVKVIEGLGSGSLQGGRSPAGKLPGQDRPLGSDDRQDAMNGPFSIPGRSGRDRVLFRRIKRDKALPFQWDRLALLKTFSHGSHPARCQGAVGS